MQEAAVAMGTPPTSAKPLLPIDQALQRVLEQVQPLDSEIISLHEAHGRVLAVAAHADLDQPAFDRAAMDGIALRAADALEPGAALQEIGEAAAGTPFAGQMAPGTCIRIMTGGLVPAGANAVVPIERIQAVVTELGRSWRLQEAVRPEQHVARRGSEVQAGQLVLPSGSLLTGARIGVLAMFGHAQVAVARRPTVAMLPTGDEIVAVERVPGPGQVRDANRHALTGLLLGAGARVVQHVVAADRRDALAAAIAAAWQEADVVVMSGGVSAGDYDFVAPALSDLGADCHIHQIRIKPGKPFLFATRTDLSTGRRQLAFGLPGNPISSYVCCALFVLPALAALQGRADTGWQVVQVPSLGPLPAVGPRTELLPARLVDGEGGSMAEVLPVRGSADLTHFAAASWLVMRPHGAPAIAAGDLVDLIVWPRP